MSVFGVNWNGELKVNSTNNMSAYVQSFKIAYEADMLDATAWGSRSKQNMAGLLKWEFDVTFVDDLTNVDGVLFPLVGADPFPVTYKPDASSIISASNPEYQGTAVLSGAPVGGNHGTLLVKTVKFICSGTIVRDVTP